MNRKRKVKLREIRGFEFPNAYDLFCEAFPNSERRPYVKERALLNDPRRHLMVPKQPIGFDGIIAWWEFPDFVYGEYLAIRGKLRNGGLGGKMFDALCRHCQKMGKTMIFEVEPPEDDMAKRRIGFYERHGCVLNPYSYIQPSLGLTEGPRLQMISWPQSISQETFEHFKKTVFREVYHRDVTKPSPTN